MPILKKPGAAGQPAKPQPAAAQPGRPAPGGKPAAPKGDAFAARYAQTDAAAGGGYVPPVPGSYNALITEAQGVVDGDATSAYLECTICDDVNEMQGKTCRIYFNFTDEDGNEAAGMPYFKSAMTQLGQTDDFGSWDEMVEFLAELARQEVWVVIDVKKKGKWTNIYLASVPEDQDSKPSYE